MRKVWQIFNVFENATGDSVVESYVTIAKQEAQKQAKEAGAQRLIRHADDLIYLACALVVVALLLLFHQVLVAKLGCVSHGWCFRSIP